jgi:hypothetical protein
MAYGKKKAGSKSGAKQGYGDYTQWRLIVSQQRKIAHDTLNALLTDNYYCTQSTLYWAIHSCYEYDLIGDNAKQLLEKINDNGNIARHEWTTLGEQVMLNENIVYINSVFDDTYYQPNHTDSSFCDEAIQILTHRDLIHILRDNDLSEEGSFMKCLNKAKEHGLISDEQYKLSKNINKKGNKSKHPDKKQ